MANLFSDLLTLRDTEGVITDASTYAGEAIKTNSFINLTSNVADDDVIMMLDLPSNSKPYSIFAHNTDLGTDSVSDWGIYASRKFTDTDASATVFEENQVIVIDAFDANSALLNSEFLDFHSDKRFQLDGSATSLTRVGDAMWQLAGLDSDPHVDMRIGIALTTNWTIFTPGFISMTAHYSAK